MLSEARWYGSLEEALQIMRPADAARFTETEALE